MQRYLCAFFCVLAAQFICGADNARVNTHASAGMPACGLNGNYHTPKRKHIKAGCVCDSGWMGPSCSVLNLALMQPLKQQHGQQLSQQQVPGVDLPNQPTWGGGAVFEDGKWHFLVGARAVDRRNNSLDGYPCDSKIIRAVSATSDP